VAGKTGSHFTESLSVVAAVVAKSHLPLLASYWASRLLPKQIPVSAFDVLMAGDTSIKPFMPVCDNLDM
jgi:hypothetical protein